MPKSLHEWLHYSALKWMMSDRAIQEDHGGTWHRAGDSDWTQCGRWVSGSWKRDEAGFGFGKRSPWWGSGSLKIGKLCPKCFAKELPIVSMLERVVVHGEEE
jgi:hypothetical protein